MLLRALHCERLAGARLPVGKDGAVEALERLPQDRRAEVAVDLLLRRIAVVDGVESEALLILARRDEDGLWRARRAQFVVVVLL